jgi:hypothetical protein
MGLPNNYYSLSEQVTDIGTADAKIFVVPSDGFLRKVETVLAGAITAADETVTVSHNGTNLAPTITITQSGSAAGDYDVAEFYRGVRKGDRIVVTNDGASTGATKCAITVTLSK